MLTSIHLLYVPGSLSPYGAGTMLES